MGGLEFTDGSNDGVRETNDSINFLLSDFWSSIQLIGVNGGFFTYLHVCEHQIFNLILNFIINHVWNPMPAPTNCLILTLNIYIVFTHTNIEWEKWERKMQKTHPLTVLTVQVDFWRWFFRSTVQISDWFPCSGRILSFLPGGKPKFSKKKLS